jgi:hypothetical protein
MRPSEKQTATWIVSIYVPLFVICGISKCEWGDFARVLERVQQAKWIVFCMADARSSATLFLPI